MIEPLRPALQRIAEVTRIALMAVLMAGLAGCGSEKQEAAAVDDQHAGAETFTFFELGANSQYSEATRRSLEDKLGNDAISYRNMVDLEPNYPGFLKHNFADLDDLNQRLNSKIGERIDHDTVKLMYRYARKREVLFDYVEILFSNFNKRPLLLTIRFKEDRSGTIDQLQAKYGPPEEIDWGSQGGKTLFWKKQQDYLMLSLVPDQFGKLEHRINIYFTANLQELIETEKAQRQRSGEAQPASGKSPF